MQHGPLRAKQSKVGSGGERPRSNMHHVLVGDVAIGENDLIDGMSAAQFFELRLFDDRNAFRIKPTGKRRWITPIIDTDDLSRSEGDDFNGRIVAVDDIEIMEISSRSTHDDYASEPKAALLARLQHELPAFSTG
jgi:hypothetical protein